jgi:hypothetical protein
MAEYASESALLAILHPVQDRFHLASLCPVSVVPRGIRCPEAFKLYTFYKGFR